MADATGTGNQDALEPTPRATYGFGPRESADETRQAQQTVSNDAPTDVNFNSIVARSQALTVDGMGKGFASNQDRRDKIMDHMLNKLT